MATPRARPILLLTTCIGCGDATPPLSWTWQSEDAALAERWLQTCNQDGPRPGECPRGTACMVQAIQGTGPSLATWFESASPVGPRGWCVATDPTVELEAVPLARGEAVEVTLRMLNTDGEPLEAPQTGVARIVAAEPDRHRRETADVRPDGEVHLSLEPGDWHIQIDRRTEQGAPEATTEDTFPWGIPDAWLHVEQAGTLDVVLPTSRIRLLVNGPQFAETLTLNNANTTVTWRLGRRGHDFLSPPLAPGNWSVRHEDYQEYVFNIDDPLLPGEVRERPVETRTHEVDVQIAPSPSATPTATYHLGFMGNGELIERNVPLYLRDGESLEDEVVSLSVPFGRWEVWFGLAARDSVPGLSGWTRLGADVELPAVTTLSFPEMVQDVDLTWSDGATGRDPDLVKVFSDGAWTSSPLSVHRTWKGEAEAWLQGDCTEQRPGPLLRLEGSWEVHDAIRATVPVARVTIVSDLDIGSATGGLYRLDPETGIPLVFPGFARQRQEISPPDAVCAFNSDGVLLLFPGRYQFTRSGAVWEVDITGDTTLDLSIGDTQEIGVLANGAPITQVQPKSINNYLSLKDLGSGVVDDRQFKSEDDPYVRGRFEGPQEVTWLCYGTCAPVTGTVRLADHLQLTRKLVP